MTADYLGLPVDAGSAQRMADAGLRLGLIPLDDREALRNWFRMVNRGFHAPVKSAEAAEEWVAQAHRRTLAVWDENSANAAEPVGTVDSWPSQLTVPGGSSVIGWAISGVTVAPTHRRKGIARALIEGELRTAAALGLPVAMLTVSESTIYRRFGFEPAAMSVELTIDTRRARWTGPAESGRVVFRTLEQIRSDAPVLAERVRLQTPGEIETWPYMWDRMLGLSVDEKEHGKHIRAVRYDDEAGVPQGIALYRVKEPTGDFSRHVVEVSYLAAATDDAYAGLWKFLLEQDLVSEVKAWLRSVDEPISWQVADWRAITRTESDHLWLRIVDVKQTLEGRRYSAAGRFGFDVEDPLGLASGRYLLEVDSDGSASVNRLEGEPPDDAALVQLSVNELSAIYLGGVRLSTLARAGRVRELRERSTTAIDSTFRSPVAPALSIWF